MLKSGVGRGLGLLVALGFLLPAYGANANSFETLLDGDASAAIGTTSLFDSVGPTVMWSLDQDLLITQFFQISGAQGLFDLALDGVPTLSDTNGFIDNRDDKFEGTWLGQGGATGVVVDLSVKLRGTSDESTLTELVSVTNNSASDISLIQYVITSFDGTGPVVDEPIDNNTFGFDEDGVDFLESVTPGWDFGDSLDVDEGATGGFVSWNIAAGESLLISKIKHIEVPEPSTAGLLAFALVGLGLTRRRRISGRGAALLAAALLFGSAGGAQALPLPALPSLAVGEISVDFDFLAVDDSLGVNWQVDDTTWVRQEFFLFPDEEEVALLQHGNLVDVQVISASEATLTFANAFSDWDWLISMNFDLAALDSTSDLAETITVINNTDIGLVFIQEVITTLGGSADGDQVTAFGENIATVQDGDSLFEEVVLGIPDGREEFSDNEFGFLWEIGAGESDLITKDKRLEIPEPSGLALLALAGLVGLRARRRR